MVVLKRLIMLVLLLTTLVGCTEDQFIEITPTEYGANDYEVSFKNDIYEPIFYNNGEGKCMNCHSSSSPYVQLEPLNEAYDNLLTGVSFGNEPYVDTLNPSQSHLYKRLIGSDNLMIMPPNSSSNGSLTSEEIERVFLWIRQGAKNN